MISDLASLFSMLAVLIAIIALVVEGKRERFALQADHLLRLDEKLHSPGSRSLRRAAARKLSRNKKPNYELEEVLEHLSTIAFFFQRKAIDSDLTFKQFSYWLVRYWLCGRGYVLEVSRKYDPQSYATLEQVADQFIRDELKGGHPPFDEALLQAFLQEESGLPGAA